MRHFCIFYPIWEEAVDKKKNNASCIPIYDYFTTPGGSTERIKLFCAKVDSRKTQEFCGLKEEHEDIKVHVIPTEDAFAAVRSGQINNGFTIIALQWLELNLQNVNDKW